MPSDAQFKNKECGRPSLIHAKGCCNGRAVRDTDSAQLSGARWHLAWSGGGACHDETVPDRMKLVDVADSASLTFECGYLPADAAIFATGHQPNGYFWEGVVEYLAGSL